MKAWNIFCIVLASLQFTHAQTASGLCDDWRMVNGAGYNSHPDCDKYVQCHYNGQGEVQQCSFSTYWVMDLLTCLPVKEANCSRDKCANQTDGTILGAEGNCRGYWRCAGGQSEPMCCPVGQKYDDILVCVDTVENECTSKCFNDNSTVEIAPVCDDKRDAGILGMFEEQVQGWGWIKRHCAPGTTFVKALCRCDDRTDVSAEHLACKPEVQFTFTNDYRDESGNGYYVLNENVEVLNGVAKFNGVNSRLIIPRFTNLEHSTTVVIKAKYSSNHNSSTGLPRAVVSNGACKNSPTIMLSEDESTIYFGVGTSDVQFAYASVQQLAMDVKDVAYTLDNNVLTGTNVVNVDSVPATGFLRNAQCALHIGDGQNLNSFKGEIDELSVYLCNPDRP